MRNCKRSYGNKSARNGSYSFGEDFWDLLELLIFIERHKLIKHFPLYNKFKKYAINVIRGNEFYLTNNKWEGVGVVVNAIKYCKLIKQPYSKLISLMKNFKNSNETYGNEKDILNVIWHSSQVITILDETESKMRTFKALSSLISDKKFLSDYNRNYYLAYLGLAYIQDDLQEFVSDKEYIFNMIFQTVKCGTLATDRCALCATSQFYIALLQEDIAMVKIIALKDILIPSYELRISTLTKNNEQLSSVLEKYKNSYPVNKKLIKALKWVVGVIIGAIITAIITILITQIFSSK